MKIGCINRHHTAATGAGVSELKLARPDKNRLSVFLFSNR